MHIHTTTFHTTSTFPPLLQVTFGLQMGTFGIAQQDFLCEINSSEGKFQPMSQSRLVSKYHKDVIFLRNARVKLDSNLELDQRPD